jgi:hypothetical protein
MNKFLPIENIIYKTKLSKEQTIQKLTENIETEKSFGFGAHNYTYSKPYIGRILGNSFEIKRAISYRNSFLPQIKGEIYSEFDGTKIKVNMKPHSLVLVFMTIWFGGVFLACIGTTYALFTQKFTPFFFIPFGMLLFGIGLLFGAFKTESSTSKKDLLKIFDAKIENEK